MSPKWTLLTGGYPTGVENVQVDVLTSLGMFVMFSLAKRPKMGLFKTKRPHIHLGGENHEQQ